MVKKRIIFTLLYDNDSFCLSRNFNIQHIGDLNWLNTNYNFSRISYFIDELVIINISRINRDIIKFSEIVKEISFECFAPITAGGGINNIKNAEILFKSGADKILINTAAYKNPKIISDLAKNYGNQSIVVSIDYQKINNTYRAFINNGSTKIKNSFENYFNKILKLPIGEIYLNSIDQDGTGQGYDMEILKKIYGSKVPIIMSGGAGNYKHLVEGLNEDLIDAVSSANLLNFIGDGLKLSRKKILDLGFNLAKW